MVIYRMKHGCGKINAADPVRSGAAQCVGCGLGGKISAAYPVRSGAAQCVECGLGVVWVPLGVFNLIIYIYIANFI